MKAEISLSFQQILELVKQLPKQQKLKLSKELEQDFVQSRLSQLLKAFKTDKLKVETIDKEVEAVRQQIYDKKV